MYGFINAVLADKGRQVYAVSPNETVREAVRQMNHAGVGAVIVAVIVNDHHKLVGIFTERDVLRRVVDQGRNPDTTHVKDVMTSDLFVVQTQTRIEDAMAMMTAHRCRHLPVLDGGELVGLVSIGDLNRWASLNLEAHLQQLTEYITGPVG